MGLIHDRCAFLFRYLRKYDAVKKYLIVYVYWKHKESHCRSSWLNFKLDEEKRFFLLYFTLKECLDNLVGRMSVCSWIHSWILLTIFALGMLEFMVWVNRIVHKPQISALFPVWVNNIRGDSWMASLNLNGHLKNMWTTVYMVCRWGVRKTRVLIPAESSTTSMKLG